MSNQSPVFEMILKSLGEESRQFAKAAVSDKSVGSDWQEHHQEGQLAVDVAQTDSEVLLVSTLAGAETDKIEVYIHNDLLTIRGERHSPLQGKFEINYQECFWGIFSRTIILPAEVKAEMAVAEYKNGILLVKIPKRKIDAKIPIIIVEE